MIPPDRPQGPLSAPTTLIAAGFAFSAFLLMTGCGKKGPPLPPLVKLPAAPANFTAQRRGADVDFQFDVPAANTDNTRPANIARVEIYGMTTAEALPEDQIVKQGAIVAQVAVKAPRDPDQTIEEDESAADMETPEGQGLDQGAVGHASETLSPSALAPVQPRMDKTARRLASTARPAGPLLPPRVTPLVRSYVAVGVSARDKKGAATRRVQIPLLPPPPMPQSPLVTYDEKAIAVKWDALAAQPPVQRAAASGELPSRPIGPAPLAIAYNVYDGTTNARLTATPVSETAFTDSRIVWGEQRCYTIRAVETIGDLRIESDAPKPSCKTLKDTFAPNQPTNLMSSPASGVISLIWDPNSETDLAGYIVLRGTSVETLQPMFTDPIQETTFRDTVQPGIRFTYAIVAVDRAGNRSAPSKAIEEVARE